MNGGERPLEPVDDLRELFRRSPHQAVSFLRPLLVFGFSYSLTTAPLIFSVLISSWDSPLCVPLRIWIFVQLILQIFQFPIRLYILFQLRTVAAAPDPRLAATRLLSLSSSKLWSCNRFLGFVTFGWFILGTLWVWDSNGGCANASPELYKLSLALFVIFVLRYVMTFLWFCYTFCWDLASIGGGTRGASPQMISKLDRFKYSSGQQLRQDTCVICLQEFESDEDLNQLPCSHSFHAQCVSTWLLRNKSCPLCQHNIDQPFSFPKPNTPSPSIVQPSVDANPQLASLQGAATCEVTIGLRQRHGESLQ